MPKFSIIMQCFLGDYPGAASNREDKLIRAVKSIIDQTFKDWELIIIADGCDRTFDLVSEHFIEHDNINCVQIQKQKTWSGTCRNFGLSKATGEYCLYLDADDYFGPNHLRIINDNINNFDWAYFNDFVKTNDSRVERRCTIQVKGQFGTSNIVHKRSLGAKWTSFGYGSDDWGLVEHLKRLSDKYQSITTPEYIVCHIPKRVDL